MFAHKRYDARKHMLYCVLCHTLLHGLPKTLLTRLTACTECQCKSHNQDPQANRQHITPVLKELH